MISGLVDPDPSGNIHSKPYGSIPPVAVASILKGPSWIHCSITGAKISTGKVEYTEMVNVAVPKQPTLSVTLTVYVVPLTGLGMVILGVISPPGAHRYS